MDHKNGSQSRLKLMLVAPAPPPYGGIANWACSIRDKISHDPTVELCGFVDISPGKRSVDGRTMWDRVVKSGLDTFRIKKELKQKCRENRPDLIHITTSGKLAVIRDIRLLKTAKKMKIPTAYHLHFGRVPQISGDNTLEWKLIKKAIAHADAAVAIDRSTYDALLGFFNKDKIFDLPNPIDISSVKGEPAENKKEIMFLGWCLKTKGIEELLAAWEMLHASHPDWTLRLVGPYHDGYISELRDKYSFKGVILQGECEHADALDLLSQAAIFTLPSYTEGFPNVILEAMAYRKAIVATTVGAIPQMIDGCGVLVQAQSAEQLRTALDTLMADPELCSELGRKAHARLMDKFEMNVVYEQYRKMWEKTMHDPL